MIQPQRQVRHEWQQLLLQRQLVLQVLLEQQLLMLRGTPHPEQLQQACPRMKGCLRLKVYVVQEGSCTGVVHACDCSRVGGYCSLSLGQAYGSG
eukprot:7854429-Ditylum_brightwellii.AAC.1